MLRTMTNDKLFELYDQDMVLRVHNERNLKYDRSTLGKFKGVSWRLSTLAGAEQGLSR